MTKPPTKPGKRASKRKRRSAAAKEPAPLRNTLEDARRLLEGEASALMVTAIELAHSGDPKLLALVVERLLQPGQGGTASPDAPAGEASGGPIIVPVFAGIQRDQALKLWFGQGGQPFGAKVLVAHNALPEEEGMPYHWAHLSPDLIADLYHWLRFRPGRPWPVTIPPGPEDELLPDPFEGADNPIGDADSVDVREVA